MIILIVRGDSTYRSASRDESVQTRDESVETSDNSIEARQNTTIIL